MQPIHQGLPNNGLYNGNAMRTVSVCLDSGMIATAACGNDARQMDRVVSPLVYPDDVPNGTCTKHVSVEYCVTGGGVATEYCSRFEDVEIAARSLVKLTQAEVNEIKNAIRTGVYDVYADDGYVYFVGEDGDDAAWHGFYGGYAENTMPYLVCPVHTQEAWEAYEPSTEPENGWQEDWGTENDYSNWQDPSDDNGNNNSGGSFWG